MHAIRALLPSSFHAIRSHIRPRLAGFQQNRWRTGMVCTPTRQGCGVGGCGCGCGCGVWTPRCVLVPCHCLQSQSWIRSRGPECLKNRHPLHRSCKSRRGKSVEALLHGRLRPYYSATDFLLYIKLGLSFSLIFAYSAIRLSELFGMVVGGRSVNHLVANPNALREKTWMRTMSTTRKNPTQKMKVT